ncbi:MAG TPA: tRNA pseudouridine(38-40) synthase TruA [Ktedonobacterales bacterium]
MAKVALLVEYDGTRFAGFQRQAPEKGPTVQGAIETAIGRVSGDALTVAAAGRTDSGVHASGQVVNFGSSARLTPLAWGRAVNAYLPEDVAVRAAARVAEGFHARFSALARSYRYRVFVAPARSPLRERYALRMPHALDVAAMDEAAGALLGEHDFGAFGASPSSGPSSGPSGARGHCVRRMLAARCRLVEGSGAEEMEAGTAEIAFDFTANAFLSGMVRRLVGTLLLVGGGRLSREGFAAILAARAKAHPGAAVAARGLCLVGVTYPEGALNWERVG